MAICGFNCGWSIGGIGSEEMRLSLISLSLCLAIAFLLEPIWSVAGESLYERFLFNKHGGAVAQLSAPQGSGTGFLLQTSKGMIIITNEHVCSLAFQGMILVTFPNGLNFLSKVIKTSSKGYDLCSIEAPKGFVGLKLGKKPSIMDRIYSLGYPSMEPLQIGSGFMGGQALAETIIPITTECKGLSKKMIKVPQYPQPVCVEDQIADFTTLLTAGGASGSPVLNQWGEVIGVIFGVSPKTNHALTIPYWELLDFINEQ